MSGFTEAEIAAEMAARSNAFRKRDVELAKAVHREAVARADTNCLHCGMPMHSYNASDRNNPLCDNCLGD